MDTITKTRRDFLKKLFTISVVTASCPHILLGELSPELKEKDDKIQGIYTLKLANYPDLIPLWGSIRLMIPDMEGLPQNIVIAHVDKNIYGKDYVAVNELCPHEGQQISLLHPEEHIYICSGHGTIFDADGTYKEGPAAQDLEKYPVNWDGGEFLKIDLFFYSEAYVNEIQNLAYLRQNTPNPCSNISKIKFGIEKFAFVKISLYDYRGNEVYNIFNNYQNPGQYEIPFNVSGLANGSYLCKMIIDNKTELLRKVLVIK